MSLSSKLSDISSVRMHDLRSALYGIGNYIACVMIIGVLACIQINGPRFQKRQNKINLRNFYAAKNKDFKTITSSDGTLVIPSVGKLMPRPPRNKQA